MNIKREIIVDLLPVYFSGEASDATKALVEEQFYKDAEFERWARSTHGILTTLRQEPLSEHYELEKLAFKKTRKFLQYTQLMKVLATVAVAYTFLSIALLGIGLLRGSNQTTFATGIAFSICSGAMWFAYAISYARQKISSRNQIV